MSDALERVKAELAIPESIDANRGWTFHIADIQALVREVEMYRALAERRERDGQNALLDLAFSMAARCRKDEFVPDTVAHSLFLKMIKIIARNDAEEEQK